MIDLMIYDRLKEIYYSYIVIKKQLKHKDYIFKAGEIDVPVTADQRDHG